MNKDSTQLLMKIGSLAFAAFTVAKTLRTAREDEDGLQLTEALVRGTALALSAAVLIRQWRRDTHELQAAEA